jgi:hypothetical protein
VSHVRASGRYHRVRIGSVGSFANIARSHEVMPLSARTEVAGCDPNIRSCGISSVGNGNAARKSDTVRWRARWLHTV